MKPSYKQGGVVKKGACEKCGMKEGSCDKCRMKAAPKKKK